MYGWIDAWMVCLDMHMPTHLHRLQKERKSTPGNSITYLTTALQAVAYNKQAPEGAAADTYRKWSAHLAQERRGGTPVMGGALLPIQMAPLEGGGRGGEGAALRSSLARAREGPSLRYPPPLHLPASRPISRVQDADIPVL